MEARKHIVVACLLVAFGCARSHLRTSPEDADAGAPSAEEIDGGCPPVSDAIRTAARAFEELSCDDPRVVDFAELATEIALAPGLCAGTIPTNSPFVPVGVWAGLREDFRVRAGCMHIDGASPRSGVEVGANLDAFVFNIAVPYDAVDLSVSFVGVDTCGRLVRGSRVLRSDAFPGPRLLLSTDERALDFADGPRDRVIYATADRVVDDGEAVSSPNPRELLGWGLGAVWIEGDARLRVHDPRDAPEDDRRLAVHPDAVLRVVGPGRLVVVEPERLRVVTVPADRDQPLREDRAFDLPAGLSDPVVFGHEIAFAADGGIRIWDVDTGAERVDLAGFAGAEHIFPGPTQPFPMRDGRILQYASGVRSFALPDWDRATAPLDAAIAAELGPLLGVFALDFAPPVVLVGANGVTALHDPDTAAHVAPTVFSAEALGGTIRRALKVWQWRMWLLVDRPDGGSSIYDIGLRGGSWGAEGMACPPWEDGG